MKRLFLHSLLLTYAVTVFSQNSSHTISKINEISASAQWDLKKYVWSHSHPAQTVNEKKIIDFDAIDNWIHLPGDDDVSISRNAEYFAYGVKKYLGNRIDTQIVMSTSNSWRQEFTKVDRNFFRSGNKVFPGFFSSDSKLYIANNNDGLCFLQLQNGQRDYIKDIDFCKIPSNIGTGWLACRTANPKTDFILKNFITGIEKRFQDVYDFGFDNSSQWLTYLMNSKGNEDNAKDLGVYQLVTGLERHFQRVVDYTLSGNGKALFLKLLEKQTDSLIMALKFVSLPEGDMKTIWAATDPCQTLSNYSIDESGNQVVFIVKSHVNNSDDYSIWYWKQGMEASVMVVNNQKIHANVDLLISGPVSFTSNGHYIQFSLKQIYEIGKPLPNSVAVDVWSYKDTNLQSTQSYNIKEPKMYQVFFNQENGSLFWLKEFEDMRQLVGDYAIIYKSNRKLLGDRFWETGFYKDSCWLLSLKNGDRKYIARGSNYNFNISPGANYLVYYDADNKGNYFSYDIHSGRLTMISAGIPDWQLGRKNLMKRSNEKPMEGVGIAGWLEGDKSILVYDNNDVWQMDLTGKSLPRNITNGYGRLHESRFLVSGADGLHIFRSKDTLLFSVFERRFKMNGFYRKVLGTAGDPEYLFMGKCSFQTLAGTNRSELKAFDVNAWIVKRQTAIEAPNYFITRDFKKYVPLTNIQPHKNYNWLTSELHSFKQLDGTLSQGVLYKPENFDPAKKYPVIISFYGPLSDQVYQYMMPEYINAPHIYYNPAWMVSHGYLVFTPDIYFTQDQWGPSTVNTIEGAVRYLRLLPYVDGEHLGACGHSNSGRFGYYLLTHSHSFAAMAIGSGFTGADVLSGALSLQLGGKEESCLEVAEKVAYGTGLGNIWQNKARWIDHIAPLQADKASSAFLLFHNKKDGDDVRLAIELYSAFRRLEKRAWWLQYDKGGHTLGNTIDQRDFTIRFTQFFDHYLKRAPAPSWMTKGIPYQLKGIEARYELDLNGQCGKSCPVCEAKKNW